MGEFCTPLKTNRRLNNDPIVIPPSPFLKKLGYGTGVAVYEFERSPKPGTTNSPWAIKKLIKNRLFNTTYDFRLKEEAKILKKLNHPNIIGFRAFVKTSDNQHCLAMEECTNCLGDMIEQRFEEDLSVFPAKNIMKVAWDISEALNYLHTQALILHGDVKSFNILINGDFNICKLCDFGVSLPLTKDGIVDHTKTGNNSEYIGTRLWSAPEVFQKPQVLTNKADIYSYGLVLWEMIALMPPRLELLNEDSFTGDTEGSSTYTENESDILKRPNLPPIDLDETYRYVLELFHCCTHDNLEHRPSAQDLTISIPEMIKELGFMT